MKTLAQEIMNQVIFNWFVLASTTVTINTSSIGNNNNRIKSVNDVN